LDSPADLPTPKIPKCEQGRLGIRPRRPLAIDAPRNDAILSLLPNPSIEDIMAKKTSTKKPATKAKKKAATKKVEEVEIELDAIEIKAIELAHSSAKVQTELEAAATLAISQSVRKVFKQHGISLSPPQAQEIAELLFGDGEPA
jgi:hypothetical protein